MQSEGRAELGAGYTVQDRSPRRKVKPFQESSVKLLILTGSCELTTGIGELPRALEVSVSPRAVQTLHLLQGSTREALGALLKRRICLGNLTQQIPGLWAEVKLSWNQTLRDFVWAGAIGAEGGGRAGGQVQEATVVLSPSSQLPAGPRGFSSLPWQPEGGWGRAGAVDRQTDRHLSGEASRTALPGSVCLDREDCTTR